MDDNSSQRSSAESLDAVCFELDYPLDTPLYRETLDVIMTALGDDAVAFYWYAWGWDISHDAAALLPCLWPGRHAKDATQGMRSYIAEFRSGRDHPLPASPTDIKAGFLVASRAPIDDIKALAAQYTSTIGNMPREVVVTLGFDDSYSVLVTSRDRSVIQRIESAAREHESRGIFRAVSRTDNVDW